MRVSEVGYVTPAMRYDAEANVMIFERRDPDTGQVAFQVPSASAVQQRRAQTAQTSDGAKVNAPSGDKRASGAGDKRVAAEAPTQAPPPPPSAGARVSVFA